MKRFLVLCLVLVLCVSSVLVPASAASTSGEPVSVMGLVEWSWRAHTGSTTYNSGSFYYGTVPAQSSGSQLSFTANFPSGFALMGGYDEIEIIVESNASTLPSITVADQTVTYSKKVGSRFYYSMSRDDLHLTNCNFSFVSRPSGYVQILDFRLSGSYSTAIPTLYKGNTTTTVWSSRTLSKGESFSFICSGDFFHSTWQVIAGGWTGEYWDAVNASISAEVFDDGQYIDLPVDVMSFNDGSGRSTKYAIVIDLRAAPDDGKVVVTWYGDQNATISDYYIRYSNVIDDNRFFLSAWFQRLSSSISSGLSSLASSIATQFSDLKSSLSSWFSSLSTTITTQFTNLKTSLSGWFSHLEETIQNAINPSDAETVPADEFSEAAGGIDNFEQSQMGSIDSNMNAVQSSVSISGIATSLAFVQRYANGVFSGLGDAALLFTFPLFLGIFFYLCSRVPNNTHHKGGDDDS